VIYAKQAKRRGKQMMNDKLQKLRRNGFGCRPPSWVREVELARINSKYLKLSQIISNYLELTASGFRVRQQGGVPGNFCRPALAGLPRPPGCGLGGSLRFSWVQLNHRF
jgi:hypothetical protein